MRTTALLVALATWAVSAHVALASPTKTAPSSAFCIPSMIQCQRVVGGAGIYASSPRFFMAVYFKSFESDDTGLISGTMCDPNMQRKMDQCYYERCPVRFVLSSPPELAGVHVCLTPPRSYDTKGVHYTSEHPLVKEQREVELVSLGAPADPRDATMQGQGFAGCTRCRGCDDADFDGVDLTGKIVLVKRRCSTKWSTIESKGAAGVILSQYYETYSEHLQYSSSMTPTIPFATTSLHDVEHVYAAMQRGQKVMGRVVVDCGYQDQTFAVDETTPMSHCPLASQNYLWRYPPRSAPNPVFEGLHGDLCAQHDYKEDNLCWGCRTEMQLPRAGQDPLKVCLFDNMILPRKKETDMFYSSGMPRTLTVYYVTNMPGGGCYDSDYTPEMAGTVVLMKRSGSCTSGIALETASRNGAAAIVFLQARSTYSRTGWKKNWMVRWPSHTVKIPVHITLYEDWADLEPLLLTGTNVTGLGFRTDNVVFANPPLPKAKKEIAAEVDTDSFELTPGIVASIVVIVVTLLVAIILKIKSVQSTAVMDAARKVVPKGTIPLAFATAGTSVSLIFITAFVGVFLSLDAGKKATDDAIDSAGVATAYLSAGAERNVVELAEQIRGLVSSKVSEAMGRTFQELTQDATELAITYNGLRANSTWNEWYSRWPMFVRQQDGKRLFSSTPPSLMVYTAKTGFYLGQRGTGATQYLISDYREDAVRGDGNQHISLTNNGTLYNVIYGGFRWGRERWTAYPHDDLEASVMGQKINIRDAVKGYESTGRVMLPPTFYPSLWGSSSALFGRVSVLNDENGDVMAYVLAANLMSVKLNDVLREQIPLQYKEMMAFAFDPLTRTMYGINEWSAADSSEEVYLGSSSYKSTSTQLKTSEVVPAAVNAFETTLLAQLKRTEGSTLELDSTSTDKFLRLPEFDQRDAYVQRFKYLETVIDVVNGAAVDTSPRAVDLEVRGGACGNCVTTDAQRGNVLTLDGNAVLLQYQNRTVQNGVVPPGMRGTVRQIPGSTSYCLSGSTDPNDFRCNYWRPFFRAPSGATAITMHAWVKLDAPIPAGPPEQDTPRIFTTDESDFAVFRLYASGILAMHWSELASARVACYTTPIDGHKAIPRNEWTSVTAVVDFRLLMTAANSGRITVGMCKTYINGELYGQGSYNGQVAYAYRSPFMWGSKLSGSLDGLKVLRYPLNAEEVKHLHDTDVVKIIPESKKWLADAYDITQSGQVLTLGVMLPRDVVMATLDRNTAATTANLERMNSNTEAKRDKKMAEAIFGVIALGLVSMVIFLVFNTVLARMLQEFAELMVLASQLHVDTVENETSIITELAIMRKAMSILLLHIREYRSYLPQSVIPASESDTDVDETKSEGTTASASASVNKSMSGRVSHSTLSQAVASVSGSESHDAPVHSKAVFAVGLKSSKISYSVLNIKGWLKSTCDDGVRLETHARVVEQALDFVSKNQGMLEPFSGDRFEASYNASRQAVSHGSRALTALTHLSSWCAATLNLETTSSCVTGTSKHGNMGHNGMKRFTFVTPLIGMAKALETLAKLRSFTCLVDQRMFSVMQSTFLFFVVAKCQYDNKDFNVASVQGLLPAQADEEWMYQVDSGPTKLRTDWNTAMETVAAKGQIDEVLDTIDIASIVGGEEVIRCIKEKQALPTFNLGTPWTSP
eukprot:Rhum_TRINITY_DN4581_c0_g1::Rhum_TRINITY_DN4581_c0_g1_i1::g.14934::m.14934